VARTSKSSPLWRTNPYAHIKKEGGKRSGLETAVSADLLARGVEFKGEKEISAIEYRNLKVKKYHPDFQLPNGIIVETKGWFKTADRSKHLCIKHQRPELDIRFVFSNPNTKISRKSDRTYAMWCERHGFDYAKGAVPQAWLETVCKRVFVVKKPADRETLESVVCATCHKSI